MRTEITARLIKHVSFFESELDGVAGVRSLTWERYQTDAVQRRNVERLVENIVNSSIDIARIILNANGLQTPDTYGEIVRSLSLVAGFDRDNCEALSRQVRLRNIISHQYLDIRWSSIKKFIDEAEPYYRKLAGDVQRHLAAHI